MAAQRVLVLLSGGTDSAACASMLKAEGHDVSGLFVDYGQLARAHEESAAETIASRLRIELQKVAISGVNSGVGYVQARNALLIQVAATVFPRGVLGGLIALGLIDGAHYVDCSPTFLQAAQRVLDFYFDGRVQLVAPLISVAKPGVLRVLAEHGMPLDITYSCEAGTTPPCGTCLSCRDRAVT